MHHSETNFFGLQRTLAKKAVINGFGFWSGKDVLLEFLPAPEDFGIRFLRSGSPEESAVPALLSNRLSKPRQTSLGNEFFRFDMVEHVLSSLNGLRIDNCLIRIDGEEMPGKDGSALAFVDAINEAGITEQTLPKRVRKLSQPVFVEGDWGRIEAFPSEDGDISYTYEMDYSNSNFPAQYSKETFTFRPSSKSEIAAKEYEEKIAGARTFLTYDEAQMLLKAGLCQRVTSRDVLVFGQNGPVENQLRYSDECARHKLLDMMGDFSLSGALIAAHFHAHCSGHVQNAALLEKIIQVTEIE